MRSEPSHVLNAKALLYVTTLAPDEEGFHDACQISHGRCSTAEWAAQPQYMKEASNFPLHKGESSEHRKR